MSDSIHEAEVRHMNSAQLKVRADNTYERDTLALITALQSEIEHLRRRIMELKK